MIINGAATAGVAWLLDPAIKKFFRKDKLMLYVIPAAIVITFLLRSVSLYLTRIQLLTFPIKLKKAYKKL